MACPNLLMTELYGILELAEKMTTYVKKIQHNCNKWSMKISFVKTEVTLFQAEEKEDNIVKSNLCRRFRDISAPNKLGP